MTKKIIMNPGYISNSVLRRLHVLSHLTLQTTVWTQDPSHEFYKWENWGTVIFSGTLPVVIQAIMNID